MTTTSWLRGSRTVSPPRGKCAAAEWDGWVNIVNLLQNVIENMEFQRFNGATLGPRLWHRLETFLGRKNMAGRGPLRTQVAKKEGLGPLTVLIIDVIAGIVVSRHQ